MQQNNRSETDLGYQQLTCAASTALTIPPGCALILVTPEGQAVRWRADGVAPTASVGYPLPAGVEVRITLAQLTQIRFIEQVPGALLNVYYFGYA